MTDAQNISAVERLVGELLNRVTLEWEEVEMLIDLADGIVTEDDYNEYMAGTDPTNPLSFFQIDRVGLNGNLEVEVGWESLTGRLYSVESASNLLTATPAWMLVHTNLPATPPLNVVTNAMPGARWMFYRVRVRPE